MWVLGGMFLQRFVVSFDFDQALQSARLDGPRIQRRGLHSAAHGAIIPDSSQKHPLSPSWPPYYVSTISLDPANVDLRSRCIFRGHGHQK